jgi:hypothetical protein
MFENGKDATGLCYIKTEIEPRSWAFNSFFQQ